ncbi:hypothetical protein CHS0354_022034, partial [Potamilus streckersoni]
PLSPGYEKVDCIRRYCDLCPLQENSCLHGLINVHRLMADGYPEVQLATSCGRSLRAKQSVQKDVTQ